MTLPKIDKPLYTKSIPSTGQQIQFRGFTIKEQKILLLAFESDDEEQMVNAIKQVINNCVQTELDISNLAQFDLEYLFINISAKSSGEIIDFLIKCEHCEHSNPYSVNLMELDIIVPEKDSNIVKLNESVGIVFKYPSIDIHNTLKNIESKYDKAIETLVSCIDYIFDEESVYYTKDYKKEELIEYFEDLDKDQIEKLINWVDSIPEISHNVKFNCEKCGQENIYLIRGVKNFLA